MEHVIIMYSEGQISAWTDNDPKHIDIRESHKIRILSRVLDHIMDLKQNRGRYWTTNLSRVVQSKIMGMQEYMLHIANHYFIKVLTLAIFAQCFY